MTNQGEPSAELTRKNSGLSQLEEQAIALIASGDSWDEMAVKLGISEPTLRRCITSLYDKLGVPNEIGLLLFAVHHGLVKTDERS